MEAINAEMQKHFKITAKKKLYFALSVMFEESRNSVSETMEALKLIQKMSKEPDAPSEMTELIKGGIRKLCVALRPVYCLTQAMESYNQAMGEYPEFSKFLGIKEGVTFKQVAEGCAETTAHIQELFNKLAADGKTKAPQLKEIAFGKDFIEKCEKIKLKGE